MKEHVRTFIQIYLQCVNPVIQSAFILIPVMCERSLFNYGRKRKTHKCSIYYRYRFRRNKNITKWRHFIIIKMKISQKSSVFIAHCDIDSKVTCSRNEHKDNQLKIHFHMNETQIVQRQCRTFCINRFLKCLIFY